MTRTINTPLTVRRAGPEDALQLLRLAALDSAELPTGELLVAERAGVVLAALSLSGDTAVADPFEHTAELVDLLRMRASQLKPAERRPRRFGLPVVGAALPALRR